MHVPAVFQGMHNSNVPVTCYCHEVVDRTGAREDDQHKSEYTRVLVGAEGRPDRESEMVRDRETDQEITEGQAEDKLVAQDARNPPAEPDGAQGQHVTAHGGHEKDDVHDDETGASGREEIPAIVRFDFDFHRATGEQLHWRLKCCDCTCKNRRSCWN